MKKYLFFLFILFFTIAGYAQSFTATVDKNKILIGEKIQLNFKGSFTRGQLARWINIDTILRFEIMEKSRIDSQVRGDRVILSQVYTLTSWDSGKWNIPSFTLLNSTSAPITIDVGYTPFDVTQPYNDIKDIIDVEEPERTTWYWYLLVALLLLILFLLFFPSAKKQPPAPSVLDKDAYKKALQQLDELRESELHKKDSKEFFTRLTHIFRTYLSAGKGIKSFSKTTDDISIQLSEINLGKDAYNSLVQVLRLSDLVKFAKYNAAQDETKHAFEIIDDSIRKIEDAL